MRRSWSTLGALVALCLAAGPGPASANIYRCKGKDGSEHYTNVKPRGGRCVLAVRGKSKRKGKRQRTRKQAPKKSATAIKRVATPTSAFLPPFPIDQGPGSNEAHERCDAMPYSDFVRDASVLYQLPEPFVRAVMRVESRCNPKVVSPKGAMGLMQLMPATALAMGVTDPFDPRQNIFGGTRYLRILANRFQGDVALTLAAYNAGSGAVTRYGGIPPYKETQRYVRRVTHHFFGAR